jgi:hypothetical protein
VRFTVTKYNDLTDKVIPFFNECPILGVKYLDYLDFVKIVGLMKAYLSREIRCNSENKSRNEHRKKIDEIIFKVYALYGKCMQLKEVNLFKGYIFSLNRLVDLLSHRLLY